MGNMHGVWILHAVLIYNFLNADDQMTVAGKHCIERGTAEINPFRYIKNATALKWKSENVFLWERGYTLISTGNERL